jgi:CheY-like chemotaxis protein
LPRLGGLRDLLVTDIVMPRMDGLELILRLNAVAPWLPEAHQQCATKALKGGR